MKSACINFWYRWQNDILCSPHHSSFPLIWHYLIPGIDKTPRRFDNIDLVNLILPSLIKVLTCLPYMMDFTGFAVNCVHNIFSFFWIISVTKSKSSKRRGFYQSLELNNAILSESWGGLDRTEYRSSVHTGSWYKLTSYLKSEPTRKQKGGCPIGARPLSPKNTQAAYSLTKSLSSKWWGVLSIPGIK